MIVYLKPKFIGIFILSIISGLPLALAASTLTTMLTELKLDFSTIGLFALAGLPYSFKYLWAPLVDNINLPLLGKFGRRKSWIFLCVILVSLSIFHISLLDPVNELFLVALTAFAIAFFSVTYDIVFDAFRIESLTKEEQAAGVSTTVLGYRLGMLVSSAGSLYLASFYGWSFTYKFMSILLLVAIPTVLFLKEPTSYKTKIQTLSFKLWMKTSYLEPLSDFFERIPQAWKVLLFIALFKLGDAYAGMMTNPFLISLGFSKIEIANIVKGIGTVATLFGIFCGGLLASKVNIHRCLFLTLILQSASNLLFIVQLYAGHNDLVLMPVIFIENFVGGVGTCIFMAYLASLCNIKFTATQYALLSSFALLGRTVISGTGGFVVDIVGWQGFFIISALMSLPALFLIRSSAAKKKKTTNQDIMVINS